MHVCNGELRRLPKCQYQESFQLARSCHHYSHCHMSDVLPISVISFTLMKRLPTSLYRLHASFMANPGESFVMRDLNVILLVSTSVCLSNVTAPQTARSRGTKATRSGRESERQRKSRNVHRSSQ